MSSDRPKKLSHPAERLPETGFMCEKHGAYRGVPLKVPLFGRGIVINPPCPKCETETAGEKARQENIRREKTETGRLKAMNIGKIYWNESFDTFNAYTPELKKHLETAREFAGNPAGKLVMLGNNGAGKTHLAVTVLRERGGIMYTAYEIGVRLRQSYGGETREWEVLQELCETPLLVIDEIGRTKGSDFELNWLSHVINKRHENLLPLILISNRHLSEDCPEGESGCPKCLECFFDNDVISRIIEDGTVMKFAGDDYRYKKRMGMGKC